MEVEVGAHIAIHMLTNPIVSHSFLWISYLFIYFWWKTGGLIYII